MQLASPSETESRLPLRATIKIIESHALHRELATASVRITVRGEHVFACFPLISVSTGHESHCKVVQLGGIKARPLLERVS